MPDFTSFTYRHQAHRETPILQTRAEFCQEHATDVAARRNGKKAPPASATPVGKARKR